MRKTRRRLAAAALTIGLAAAGTAPAMADADHAPSGDLPLVGSGLLGGLLGGEGGLLGSNGLLGSAGGLLPGLLGGHSTVPEFTDGTAGLVEGLSVLPGALAGAPPVGGEQLGGNARIGDILSGVLDLGSILSGLTGRL